MGCTNLPNEDDDKMLTESAGGQNCVPDDALAQAIKAEGLGPEVSWESLEKTEGSERPGANDEGAVAFGDVRVGESLSFLEVSGQATDAWKSAYEEACREGKKVGFSEELGEQAGDMLLDAAGLVPLLRCTDKEYRQGLDGVWYDDKVKSVLLVETKGQNCRGEKPPTFRAGKGYSSRQGELFYCFGAVRRVAESMSASEQERDIFRHALTALERGRVKMVGILTTHNDGVPDQIIVAKFREVVRFSKDGEAEGEDAGNEDA